MRKIGCLFLTLWATSLFAQDTHPLMTQTVIGVTISPFEYKVPAAARAIAAGLDGFNAGYSGQTNCTTTTVGGVASTNCQTPPTPKKTELPKDFVGTVTDVQFQGFTARIFTEKRKAPFMVGKSYTLWTDKKQKHFYLVSDDGVVWEYVVKPEGTQPIPAPEPVQPDRNASGEPIPEAAQPAVTREPVQPRNPRDSTPANIWFYRTKSLTDSVLNQTIYSRGSALAKLEKGQFFGLSVSSGTYYFSFTDNPKPGREAWVTVASGQRVFFKVRYGQIRPVSPDEAAKDFRSLSPIEATNVRTPNVLIKAPFD